MDFCVGTCAKIDQVGLIKQAEDLGVTHFGVGEGPLLFSDPYQQMALASQQTSTIKMGTYVTNPLTRIAPGHRELGRHPQRSRPGPHLRRDRHRQQRAAVHGQPAGHHPRTGRCREGHPRAAARRTGHPQVAWRRDRDRIPGQDRHLVRHRRRPDLDGRRWPEGPEGSRRDRRCRHLLPRPEPGHDQTRPPRTGRRRRSRRPGEGIGQAGVAELVLPAGERRDLGRRHRQGLRVRTDLLLHHQRRVHERAHRRTRRPHRPGLHPGRDGLPGRPDRTRVSRTTWRPGPSTSAAWTPPTGR